MANLRAKKTFSREVKPSVAKGFKTMSTALKRDVVTLLEKALKKTEKGLNMLEKQLHKLNEIERKQRHFSKRRRSPQIRDEKILGKGLKVRIRGHKKMRRTKRVK